MQKIALLITFAGLAVTIIGLRNNTPTARSLGIKIAAVGLVLFLFSTFTDITIFPQIG
jgi:hypothetical protein